MWAPVALERIHGFISPLVEEAARRFQFTLSLPDPKPLAGGAIIAPIHFSFARVGIPAFSVNAGEDIIGQPAGTGKNFPDEYTDARYHQPSDEIRHDDLGLLSGMELYARFGFLINFNAANFLPTTAHPGRAGDE